MEHLHLHLLRHGGGEALNVQLFRTQSHRLHKQLVAELVREADDLRFKAGAVPGADALNQPGVHGGAIQIFLHDALGFLCGPCQPADRLIVGGILCGVGKRHGDLVARLDFHLVKIHRPGVDSGRSAGFEAPQGQSQLSEGVCQRPGGVHPVGAGIFHAGADDGAAFQIGAGGENDRLHAVHRAGGENYLRYRAVFCPHVHYLSLPHRQVILTLQRALHPLLILPAVGLRPEAPDGRAFPQIQQAVLDAAFVGGLGHFAAQRVQLPHQMAFPRAADGGIAGHIAHGVQIDGEYNGFQPQPRGGQSGFDAGMAGADDGNIKLSGRKSFHSVILFSG